jgi:DEAD/DEAH box helicase domain-containing protein
MNPILLGDEIAAGLKDLVATSFTSSSPAFADMIERFLARPRTLVQGPWLSVELPFRPGPADERLGIAPISTSAGPSTGLPIPAPARP